MGNATMNAVQATTDLNRNAETHTLTGSYIVLSHADRAALAKYRQDAGIRGALPLIIPVQVSTYTPNKPNAKTTLQLGIRHGFEFAGAGYGTSISLRPQYPDAMIAKLYGPARENMAARLESVGCIPTGDNE